MTPFAVATEYALGLSPTWNAPGQTMTALRVNVTDVSSAIGSKSSRITPLDGDAFFTSAISAAPGADRSAALASVTFLSLPLPLGAESWACEACGARWQETEEERPDTTPSED